MDAKEIISTISKIYKRFQIPPNLAQHMFEVTATAKLILANWTGLNLNADSENLIAALLTHDLGNLAKYDFSSDFNFTLFHNDAKLIEHWKQVKKKIMQKYGTNDHEVTKNMMLELDAPKRLLEIHEMISFSNNELIYHSSDWVGKIAPYADQRVGPNGVLSLQGRFDDFAIRYKHRIPKGLTPERITELQTAMFATEKQIAEHMSITPEEITNESIKEYL